MTAAGHTLVGGLAIGDELARVLNGREVTWEKHDQKHRSNQSSAYRHHLQQNRALRSVACASLERRAKFRSARRPLSVKCAARIWFVTSLRYKPGARARGA